MVTLNEARRVIAAAEKKAAEIRQFARRAHSSDVILEMLETAELFDRMTTHVERRSPMTVVR